MRLKDKIALVTGAASGFGAEMAKVFIREGAKVVLMDLNGDGARSVATSLGDMATAVRGDVTSAHDLANAVRVAVEFGGRLDVVVNNAGYTHRNKPLLEVTEEEFDRVFNINVRAIYLMIKAVVPQMRDQGGGVIINTGSTAGIRPRPGLTWYNASKGAVNLMSRSLAVELAPWKIRVNALCPVAGETAMLEALMGVPDTPENREKFISTIPLGRLARPSDVAAAALFLASDEAEFITGVEFPVDGGRTI